MDLNGTLVYRRGAHRLSVEVRPNVESFLQHIFERFTVMVWSSARPHSVGGMCATVFTPEQRSMLVAEWGRDKLGLTKKQYDSKVQVYKRLERVWDDDAIQARHPYAKDGARWDQTNTVLLDDSVVKATAQPFNVVEVPEFAGKPDPPGLLPLSQIAAYLDELRWQMDVSAFIRQTAFKLVRQQPRKGGGKPS